MNKHFNPQTPLLELDLLKTLIAIAETGNFSAAADVVFRTPSAVSMQVKRIENLLGRPVFIRDSRSVTLSDDGEMLLVHARRVLALNQKIVSHFIKPEVSGTVRLGATDHVTEQYLAKVLRRFADSHPSIIVDILVESSNRLSKLVRNGELDLAVITSSESALADDDVELLFHEKLVWAGLKCGIAYEKVPLPVSVWDDGCAWRKIGLDALSKQGKDFRISFRSAHIAGQKAGILADLVVAPLPLAACEGRIVALSEEHGLPPLTDNALAMVLKAGPPASVEAMANHLRTSFTS